MFIKTHKGKKAYEKICSTNISSRHYFFFLMTHKSTWCTCGTWQSSRQPNCGLHVTQTHLCFSSRMLKHTQACGCHAQLFSRAPRGVTEVPLECEAGANTGGKRQWINEPRRPGKRRLRSGDKTGNWKEGEGRSCGGGGSLKVKACWRKALLATVFASIVWRSEYLRSFFKPLRDSNTKIAYWWEMDEHTWTRIYVYVNACICTCKHKDII